MRSPCSRRMVTLAGFAVPLLAVAVAPALAQDKAAGVGGSFDGIAAVLLHPRCLNCHQAESPRQGAAARPHTPRVVRGPENHGVGAMQCLGCHNEMGNNPTSGVPGAPHWSLAPASMLWQDLSPADLCAQLKDPARNGGRSADALLEHMGADPLVLWGWEPGRGREPVPIPHEEFMALLERWVDGGMACPAT